MGYMGIEFVSPEMRRNTQVMLSGRVDELKALIAENGNRALPTTLVNGEGISCINSYQLAYALYDTYAYDSDQKWFKEHHVGELLEIHKTMCPPNTHVDYSKLGFVSWNNWEYYDEDDKELLLNSGVRQCDIDLTNYGAQHFEKETIDLLQKGASPYFMDVADEDYRDKDGNMHWYYGNLAPLLCHLDSEWCDQWDVYSLSWSEKNIDKLDDEDLCRHLCCLFNAGASQRMLYIIDKYIKDDVREKGAELLKRYDAYYPILRYNPEYENR